MVSSMNEPNKSSPEPLIEKDPRLRNERVEQLLAAMPWDSDVATPTELEQLRQKKLQSERDK